jgi:hypothetical protein
MKIRKDRILLTLVILASCRVAFAQSAPAPNASEVPLHGQLPPSGSAKPVQTNPGSTQTPATGGYDTPDTSADLRPDSLVMPQAGKVYKSSAEIVLVKGQVMALKASPVARYRGPHLQFFEMHFKNGSDQVAIVDADNTQAMTDKGTIRHANASAVIKGASNNLTPKGKALVTGVSLMSLGLAGPIFYEMMTPQEHAKRYLGHSIGLDGVRHDVEDGRFGRRLIMPGDETTGWVAFECSDSEAVKSLKIPVWFEPMRSPATYLDLPISQQGASL